MNKAVPQSKLALNNVEYLCLKMFLNPGETQRFYRRALAQYRGWETDHQLVGFGLYFARSSKYRNVLWRDTAPPQRLASPWRLDRWSRPLKSEMRLTKAGIKRAMAAAAKIGLDLSIHPFEE